jgi:Tfp pilus assembly ATPase PilU
MQVGSVHGMHTMDSSLYHLLTGGFITAEDALMHARDPAALKEDFKEWLREQNRAQRR